MSSQSSPNSVCPPNAIHWSEAAIGQKVTNVSEMVGSTSAIVLSLQTEVGAEYVLRLFTLKDWLKLEPDLARHEAAVLARVAQSRLQTPELIAYDETGEHTTHPAILMSKLKGKVELMPPNLDRWLAQLAGTLYQINQIPADEFGWQYKHWFKPKELSTPAWTSVPKVFTELKDYLLQPAPSFTPQFLHRDYHPANVLWENDEISGVVDWVNGCVGPAMVDVAHCRLNLVGLYGVSAADLFLDHWMTLAGPENYSVWWDIAGFANGDLFDSQRELEVYTGWGDFGKHDVSVELLAKRLDNFAISLHRKASRK